MSQVSRKRMFFTVPKEYNVPKLLKCNDCGKQEEFLNTYKGQRLCAHCLEYRYAPENTLAD